MVYRKRQIPADEDDSIKSLTIVMTKELKERIKLFSVRNGITIKDFVTTALESALPPNENA